MMSGKRKLRQNNGKAGLSIGEIIMTQQASQSELTEANRRVASRQLVAPLPLQIDKSTNLVETDCKRLLSIFPEEVWLLIFGQLKNSSDLERVSRSSSFFREILLPLRSQFLFHNVCKVLGEMKRNQEFPENSDASVQTSNNWLNEILKLRLVCQTWCTAVDSYCQNHPLHFEEHAVVFETQFPNLIVKIDNYNFDQRRNGKLLRHFTKTHVNTHRNPFVGRTIDIGIDIRDVESFVSGILSVLRLYGQHIWYCHMNFETPISGSECYLTIEESLRWMPNIKVLQIFTAYEYQESVENFEELQANIDLRPLPTLHKLEMLVTWELLPTIFHELIRRNSHIKSLIINREEPYQRYPISNLSLPELTDLKISFASEAEFLEVESPLVDWPLEVLEVDFRDSSNFIEWQNVFNVLERKFKNTLTALDLWLPVAVNKEEKDKIYREAHTYKLYLPNVTSLFIGMKNLSCLDFILPMRYSLRCLYVTVKVTDHENVIRPMEKMEAGKSRILKLLGCVRCPLESNVWNLLPDLFYVWYIVSSNKTTIKCESTNRTQWNIRKIK